MHLVFDIFQGIGIAAALGIRPFLPALAAGALAAGNVEINFDHTDYSFLESVPFLLAMAVAAVVLLVIERRLSGRSQPPSPLVYALGTIGIVLGALFFAGALAHHHHAAWPGYIGGAACALVAIFAIRPLLTRVRARLDASTLGTLPFFVEGAAFALGALSVIAPPVGPIALALLLWLLFAGRRREGQKYAGLRILR